MRQSVQEQVIKVIEEKGPCSAQDLLRHLSHVKLSTLANAAHSLRKMGVLSEAYVRRPASGPGRGSTVYKMVKAPARKPLKSKTTKKVKEERTDIPVVISLRERKINLLKQMADRSGGQTRDLLIGIIGDYGGTY